MTFAIKGGGAHKNLHNRIFGQNILHNKSAKILTIFTKKGTTLMH